MGLHGQCNSYRTRNIYATKHKVTKMKKKQRRNDKAKLQLEIIQNNDDTNELVTGIQFRNKKLKSTASGVPISGKRRNKLFKNLKREMREKDEEEKVATAIVDAEMNDGSKKSKKKRWLKKKKSKINSEAATPMDITLTE
ncbi:hypothetical protein CHUAL_006128 [Chamberlinius hualienensis]